MINIRKHISLLFNKYSHQVIYIRRNEKFKCSCYIQRSGEPLSTCPLCFGTGFLVEIEKVRTRRNLSSVPETLIGVNQLKDIGSISPKAYVYYFEHHINPKSNDFILEVLLDSKGIPQKILEKNLISTVESKLGYKGRIEFFQVYCRYDEKGVNDDHALTKS